MRRGSIQTWEPLARRQSSNMAQFSSSRSEFMTSDLGLNDIEYERKGGFFMSHKKTAIIISAFVVIIIAAGFVGAYIGSVPKEKAYDAIVLIEDDIGCENLASSKFLYPESLSPSHYRIELSPIFENETVTKLEGHVTIQFLYNGSESLQELVLSARGINMTRVTFITEVVEKSIDSNATKKILNDDAENLGNSTLEGGNSTVNGSDSMTNDEVSIIAAETNQVSDETATSINITEAETTEYSSNTTEAPSSTASLLENSTSTVLLFKNESIEISLNKSIIDEEGGFIFLLPEKPIIVGKYYLSIDYEVHIDNYVIYPTPINTTEKWVAATRIKPVNFRNCFPLFDDARKRARFSLILPRPSTMKVYSNMPLQSTNYSSKDWVVDTFEETTPISPGDLAVAVTKDIARPLEVKVRNTTINFWDERLSSTAPKYLMENIVPIFENLTEMFGVNLSLTKLDVVGLKNGDYNSADPGLVLIQESLFNVEDDSPEVTKEYAKMNLLNLIGKQWLGGLVSTDNSSDDWILQSSLLYLQHRLMEEMNPTFNHSSFIMDIQPDVYEVAGYSVSKSLQSKLEPAHSSSFYTREAYAIGACLIRMLHGALSPMEYRVGYGTFVSRWSGGTANATSFWQAMAVNSSADQLPEVGVNLPEIMNLWMTTGGYPVVTVTRNYTSGSAVVHQARFTYDKLSSAVGQQLWHIPLTWISSLDSQINLKWLKDQSKTTLQLESNVTAETENKTWIVVNPTKSGYYRVNYDRQNWKLLAEALRENHEIFSPVTRASLIDDVFSLGFARTIPYSVVYNIIEYLPENEEEPEPWAYMLQHTIKLNLVLYDSPQYSQYQDLMMKFISRLFDRVGLKINEGTRLTMIAHHLASMFDYPAYLAWAKQSYADFQDLPGLPIKNEIPSYLRGSLLCAFAKLNNELGWQWWQQKLANVTSGEERNSLLSSLACFQVPGMLQAVLNEIVFSKSFDEDDTLVTLKSFSTYPPAAQAALKFVQSNWRNITKRYSKSCKIITAFLDASSTGFTGEKDIEDFQSFRDKHSKTVKTFGYATALLEAKANASVSFIKSIPDNPISKVNLTTIEAAGIQAFKYLDLDT